jgi:16S rRNA (uracil1498-N3)-methyltransferase
LDILIEKGTELGVNQFFLFASEHTNYYTSNIKHWEKISRQAIKQSNRLHLPVISTIQKFDSLVAQSSGFHHRFVTDQSGSTPLSGLLNSETISQGSVLAVIGPEGGLSPAEIDLCRQNDFHLVSMGNSRLRAETAALTFAAYVNLIR